MSKREMLFRFDRIDEVKVPIRRIDRGHAVVVLEGIECHVTLPHAERRDLSRPGAVRARLLVHPEKRGDGSPPKGSEPDESRQDNFLHRSNDRQVRFFSNERSAQRTADAYEGFARRHPIGTIVEAEIIRIHRYKLHLRFDNGLTSVIPAHDGWDRWPSVPRKDQSAQRFNNRIEVMVRGVDPGMRTIRVSMHGFTHDDKYCNAEAGYRSAYDAREGRFRLLPWHRHRSDEGEHA